MSTTATQTQAKAPPEGCDACGVDTFGRPLQSATHSIATKSGRLFLCGSHVVQHSSALTAHVVKRIEVSP